MLLDLIVNKMLKPFDDFGIFLIKFVCNSPAQVSYNIVVGVATHLVWPTEIGNNQGDAIKYTIRGGPLSSHVVGGIAGFQAMNQAAERFDFSSEDFCTIIFTTRRTMK